MHVAQNATQPAARDAEGGDVADLAPDADVALADEDLGRGAGGMNAFFFPHLLFSPQHARRSSPCEGGERCDSTGRLREGRL